MDEAALLDHVRRLAARNETRGPDFLGGGVRRHFIPSVTPHLALQSEFVTAYTPYQPEVSQGILQATFECQTVMCELTGLAARTAATRGGATAPADAALRAVPAGGLTSDPPGHLRVPDRHVRVDRPGCQQRIDVRRRDRDGGSRAPCRQAHGSRPSGREPRGASRDTRRVADVPEPAGRNA